MIACRAGAEIDARTTAVSVGLIATTEGQK